MPGKNLMIKWEIGKFRRSTSPFSPFWVNESWGWDDDAMAAIWSIIFEGDIKRTRLNFGIAPLQAKIECAENNSMSSPDWIGKKRGASIRKRTSWIDHFITPKETGSSRTRSPIEMGFGAKSKGREMTLRRPFWAFCPLARHCFWIFELIRIPKTEFFIYLFLCGHESRKAIRKITKSTRRGTKTHALFYYIHVESLIHFPWGKSSAAPGRTR